VNHATTVEPKSCPVTFDLVYKHNHRISPTAILLCLMELRELREQTAYSDSYRPIIAYDVTPSSLLERFVSMRCTAAQIFWLSLGYIAQRYTVFQVNCVNKQVSEQVSNGVHRRADYPTGSLSDPTIGDVR